MDYTRHSYVIPASRDGVTWLAFEGACLQLRKVIELIVFASLVSNRQRYEQECSGFRKENDFAKLCKRLRAVNPNFLPTSVKLIGVNSDGTKQMVDNDVQLTSAELQRTFGRLGNILHVRNPYADELDLAEYQRIHRLQSKRIIAALRNHVAILATGEHVFIDMMGNDELIRPLMMSGL
jgi:hypothetical protein